MCILLHVIKTNQIPLNFSLLSHFLKGSTYLLKEPKLVMKLFVFQSFNFNYDFIQRLILYILVLCYFHQKDATTCLIRTQEPQIGNLPTLVITHTPYKWDVSHIYKY
jgi:hypothetical protein